MPTFVPRQQLNAAAWDACVLASTQRIVYGYSWYLDAVLPAPDWCWMGLVVYDERGNYRAVMPVPLRRKQVAGILHPWVVHQPFFCQFLSVFSLDTSLDPALFLQAIQNRFRYGSSLSLNVSKPLSCEAQTLTTHVLDLSVGYDAVFRQYSSDRRINLRRAEAANWTISDSSDLNPLLGLFRLNHADTIRGGVADWAYTIFANLGDELVKRGFGILRYAMQEGRIEAGALFVREGNRIIYLFNAASETGRKKNARTLLIDQVIRDYAGQKLVFDFESPEKQSIASFYESFGSTRESFYSFRWSRLTAFERVLVRLSRLVTLKKM
ncbi:GNAT family N-acetyltransferase [Spirosoma aureum]|uniref:GNAT family N-acetyltransferase n=1 Tax=Spirosoma aureum TaxID=2692134 RepID=A0A6G9AIX6_9BACT|nr:GNAT family N-acetyltransferase [Spirosoma aureum]QIP12294.1 GNAT family N-acetyltransferase [Spirosoma aureum]